MALRRQPVRIAWMWVPKIVTIDPPRYVPHVEWRLMFRVVAATALWSAAVLMRRDIVEWGLPGGEPARDLELVAHFFPYDWNTSDAVQVSFEGRRARLVDRALKDDPRAVVCVSAPEETSSGELVRLATLTGHDLALATLSVDALDTERRRHGRWRVRPQLADALPPFLADLASGRQTGVARPPRATS